MPRPAGSTKTPSYRYHKPSGQAVVTIGGKDFYLGTHGTKASKTEYDRLIGEWMANGRRLRSRSAMEDLRVVELAAAYWKHAKEYYYRPGQNNGELWSVKLALSPLRKLYGQTLVTDFGPLSLKVVRQEMIKSGWSRKYVNRQVGRVRQAFSWGVEQELVSATTYQALAEVKGLKRGKTKARETEPVRPVPEADVDAVLDKVSAQVKAMIELQSLTGMRPGEVCIMRTCDVDTTGRLWLYKPSTHKTEHHEHERLIYFGPKAQAILRPWFRTDLQAYLFQPKEADAHRRKELHKARKTPLSAGNSPGTNVKRRPGRKPGARYSVAAYRRAIEYACQKAFGMPDAIRRKNGDTPEQRKDKAAKRVQWNGVHVWHPNQLRHNAATRLRKEFGLEAAQVILGHKTLSVTEIYAEKNVAAAQRIMGEVG